MKRIFAAAISAVFLALTFSHCGNASAPSASSPKDASSEITASGVENSGSAPASQETKAEHEAPEPLAFRMASDPLPEENGVLGGGDGWKKTGYFCSGATDLAPFQSSPIRQEISGLSSLPVFRRNYPYRQFDEEPYQTTEEMRESYRERTESFLKAVGREDLLEIGAEPDSYLWEEDEYPAYALNFDDLSITSRAGYFSLMLSVPGLADMSEEEVTGLLKENVYLREACALGKVTDPGVTLLREYSGDAENRYITTHYRVFQRWDDPRENEISRAFAPIFITADTLGDTIVCGVRTEEASEYLGDYDIVPPEQAAAQLEKECGVQERDILSYQLEYSGDACHGYYVPYYKFYYQAESETKGVPKKASDTDGPVAFAETVLEGLTTYCAYSIRAVRDVL